jgi:hypothetical protein
VPGERLLRILAHLAEDGADPGTARLCVVCAEVTAMSGAGIMLMAGAEPRGSVCTTNEVSARIEQLQYTLGEGPCIDAHRFQRPVLEPDLAQPAASRWLGFTPPALAAGARAVFGFPLRVGSVRLGALNLYRDQPGEFSEDQHADALVMADVAARAVLGMQGDTPLGVLAAELEAGGDFQLVVHQAAGMVAAQLDVRVGEALSRLRARAFADDRLLVDVAADVVNRRLRFTGEDGER